MIHYTPAPSGTVKYFRHLHTTACTKLEELCTEWEQKSITLEQDTSESVTEEGKTFAVVSVSLL